MNIRVSHKMLKELGLLTPTLKDSLSFRGEEYFAEIDGTFFDDPALDKIREWYLKLQKSESPQDKANAHKGLVAVNGHKRMSKDPGGTPIGSLKSLASGFTEFIKKTKKKWVFRSLSDGNIVPYFVSKVEWFPGRRDNPAHTTMDLKAIKRDRASDITIYWYDFDLRLDSVGEADPFEIVYTEDSLDFGDDEEDSKKEEKKPKGRYTVHELLLRKNLSIESPALIKNYLQEVEQYKKISNLLGTQFLAQGSGYLSEIRSWYSRSDYGTLIALVRDGANQKVVMDNDYRRRKTDEDGYGRDEDKQANLFSSLEFWMPKSATSTALPFHPYCQVFDLREHRFVEVHVSNLEQYKFDKHLASKLVLNADSKDLIEMLVESASEIMEDIVTGKTGGTIVICTGPPGVGKTLTAEVYSEVLERPLYNVQCSQLGTNEVSLEKSLNPVLERASRWGAILIIDEAEVYIRERGIDIQQNAIVGVFLRLLEYYRGVLFMNSNMGAIIDDAILSRATAHLEYKNPDKGELYQIWQILSKQFKIELSETLIYSLIDAFPNISGRNVKNLLKLGRMRSMKRNLPYSTELFKWVSRFQDISTS